jgi:hypothetical protein
MDKEIILTIVGVLGTLFGTVLGWILNYLQDSRNKKIRLCFSLQPSNMEEELIDKEIRTKTSESGYCIQIYNISQIPFLFEQISLRYKKSIITDCFNTDEQKAIMPYKGCYYQLSEQDYDAILHHCKKNNLKECKVIAYDVSGKKGKGKLDLILPSIQADFRC